MPSQTFGRSGLVSVVDVLGLLGPDFPLKGHNTFKIVLSVEQITKCRDGGKHQCFKLMSLEVGDKASVLEQPSQSCLQSLTAPRGVCLIAMLCEFGEVLWESIQVKEGGDSEAGVRVALEDALQVSPPIREAATSTNAVTSPMCGHLSYDGGRGVHPEAH